MPSLDGQVFGYLPDMDLILGAGGDGIAVGWPAPDPAGILCPSQIHRGAQDKKEDQ